MLNKELTKHIVVKVHKPTLIDRLRYMFHTKYPFYSEAEEGIYCVLFVVTAESIHEYSAVLFEYDEYTKIKRAAQQDDDFMHFVSRKGHA